MSTHLVDPYTHDKLRRLDDERRTRTLELRAALGPAPILRSKSRGAAATILRRFADRLEPVPAAGPAPEPAASQ